MKDGSLKRIRDILTPKVTIEFAYDNNGEIIAQVKHVYQYPEITIQEQSITWTKIIDVKADSGGNVFSTEGLF